MYIQIIKHINILTQKREITGRMTDELDEGLSHRLSDNRVRRDDVGYRKKREQDADSHDLQRLK